MLLAKEHFVMWYMVLNLKFCLQRKRRVASHPAHHTFRLFPVGDPHRADTVGLRGQVFEVDHHPFTGLGNDHWALNTCDQQTQLSLGFHSNHKKTKTKQIRALKQNY